MKISAQIKWVRWAAEAATIVASILLAFALHAWWQGRREQLETDNMLLALHEEFSANRIVIVQHLEWARNALSAGYRLEAWGTGDGAPVPADSLAYFLTLLLFPIPLDMSSGVITRTVASDRVARLRNERVRRNLARWPDELDDATDYEADQQSVVSEQLRPVMNRHMVLPPLRRGHARAPIDELWRDPVSTHSQFATAVLGAREFRIGLNVLLDWSVLNLGDKRIFLEYVDQTIELLEAELEIRGLEPRVSTRWSIVPRADAILAEAYAQARGQHKRPTLESR